MDITPFVDEMAASLRLALAAQTEPQQADNLAAAVQAPARLALMGAVSQAAAEASTTLPSGRIGVQLLGPNLVVAFEPPPSEDAWTPPADTAEGDDEQTRLTLRLPSAIKTRAEQAAASEGISLNTWVVRTLKDATLPGSFDFNLGPMGLHMRQSTRRMRGWV